MVRAPRIAAVLSIRRGVPVSSECAKRGLADLHVVELVDLGILLILHLEVSDGGLVLSGYVLIGALSLERFVALLEEGEVSCDEDDVDCSDDEDLTCL